MKLGIFGAHGRMGRRLVDCLPAHPELTLTASVDQDSPTTFEGCDVVVDFSVAPATATLLQKLNGVALVTGTTGRDEAQRAALLAYAAHAPVFEASNFSFGIAVLNRLVAAAAAALGPSYAPEVFELHHGAKVDAPSGTALTLAQSAATGLGLSWPAARAAVREGLTGPRAPEQVGLAALRGGDVVGDHTVFFLGQAERLELTHRATDRAVLAHGALRAARWLVGRAPGLYGMDDLLGPIH